MAINAVSQSPSTNPQVAEKKEVRKEVEKQDLKKLDEAKEASPPPRPASGDQGDFLAVA